MTGGGRRDRRTGRRRHPPAFRYFLVAQAVSWTGTAMTLVALPLLIYQRTGSAALTGLLTGVEAVPYLLFGLVAGALADRWDQRHTLMATSALSATAMASVPLADALGVLTTAHLLVAAFAVATVFVFADAAGFGAVPAIVGRDGVAAATGTLVSVSTVITVAGPAAGGVLVTSIGAVEVLVLDAASYGVAAVLLSRARWTRSPTPRPAAGPRLREVLRDVGEGLRHLWGRRVVRSLTLLGIGTSLTAGAVTGLIVVVAVRRFGLAPDDARVGLLYAAAAAGTLATSLALTRIQRRAGVGTITLASLGLNWLALLGWAATTWWVPGVLLLAAFQATGSLAVLNGIVVRQAVTPMRLQSRVNTTARMIAWGGTPFGALLGGLAADTWGVPAALLLASAGVATSFAAGLATSVHRIGTLRQLIDDAREQEGGPAALRSTGADATT